MIFLTILKWFFVIVEIILIALILLRKSEIAALSSTFGGVGGDSGLGVKTQKQLDKTITWVALIFLVIAILLNKPNLWKESSGGEKAPTHNEAPLDPGAK